jgi:hypothetical protein
MRDGWCKFTNSAHGEVRIWAPSVHAIIGNGTLNDGCSLLVNQVWIAVDQHAEAVMVAVDEAKMARNRGSIDG